MAKRHHSSRRRHHGRHEMHESHRERMHEEEGMEHYLRGPVKHGRHHHSHAPDKFNDEMHHDQDSRMGDMSFNPRLAERANMNEFYAGMEPRRRQEMEDAGMIHEDQRAIANLPQEVMIKAYPKTGPYMPEGIDDTIRGIDDQMDYDDDQRRNHFYPKKV